MTATSFDLFVFDFDGTLVQTADLKRRAFFEIFPAGFGPAVEAILKVDPDGSRHVVIPEMLAGATARGLDTRGLTREALIAEYSARVTAGVAEAAEMSGASEVLRWAAREGPVYIFSMTPHAELVRTIEARGWARHVREAFGYPAPKPNVVRDLIIRHRVAPDRVLVIGDGKSDEEAAALNGTGFHRVTPSTPLSSIPGYAHV